MTDSLPRFLEPDWVTGSAAFLREKRRDGCSPATLDTYRFALLGTRTTAWRERVGIERPTDLTADALQTFADASGREGLKPASVQMIFRVLRTFARWYEGEYGGLDAAAVSLPSGGDVDAAEVRVITPEEQDRLIAACRTRRDRFLIRFLAGTGLRLSEALALTVDDIADGEAGPMVVVRGRPGRKARQVPLGELGEPARRYVREVRPRTTRRDELFLTTRRDSRTGDYRPLDGQSVTVLLGRLAGTTGIRHCCARNLRHTWVASQVAADIDPVALRRAGGWSSLRMLDRFLPPLS